MDPNEYDSLLSTLVADFENINSEIIVFALGCWRADLRPAADPALLDVLTLGKHQAINLGVDYDRASAACCWASPSASQATAMVGPISSSA